jgi:hypothetical protein
MGDDERTVIRAVLESDIERLLGRTSVDVPPCFICQQPIGEIGGFVKLDGELRVFCERATCLVAAKRGTWRTGIGAEETDGA